MLDFIGFGDYIEFGQVIFCKFNGVVGGYVYFMFLNDDVLIVGGCEIWGFLKKFVEFFLFVVKDMLVGIFDYFGQCIVIVIMGYKYWVLDVGKVCESLFVFNFMFKIILYVDCMLWICEFVCYYFEDLMVKGVWEGFGVLVFFLYVFVDVVVLLVLEIKLVVYIFIDLMLGFGEVVYDYMKD